ncbi:MAG: hypothetical protein WA952_03110, partial [Lewinella sp.]
MPHLILKHTVKIWLPVLLAIWASCLTGQALRIEYFTVTDGLSTRDINELHVGEDGYLWVATADGLNRFDGHSFVNFGPTTREKPGLSYAAVSAVHAANDGNLILTYDKSFAVFDRFDPRDFSIEQVRLLPSTGVIGYPRAIKTDQLGRTFAVTIGDAGTLLYEYTATGFQVIFQDSTDVWDNVTPTVNLLPLSNGQFLLYDEDHGFRHISAHGKLLN